MTGHSDAIFAIFGAGSGPLARADLEISKSGDKIFFDLWGHQIAENVANLGFVGRNLHLQLQQRDSGPSYSDSAGSFTPL